MSQVDKPLPPSPQKKLAPGTIKVETILVDIKEEENNTSCVMRVEKVLGYGMATRPVGVGIEIPVDLQGYDSEDLSKNSKDQKYIMIIQQQENMSISSTKSSWRALKLQKIESTE